MIMATIRNTEPGLCKVRVRQLEQLTIKLKKGGHKNETCISD